MTDDMQGFDSLGLSQAMLRAVEAKGFELPTPIQRLTIPILLKGENDIIAQSQTGTGKTAAYGLPVMQQLTRSADKVQALVLVPTRELALQVAGELISYNSEKRLSITAIYGGASISEQLRRLSKGVDIIVGTPGRIIDHIRRGTLSLSSLQYLVLDEADEMLNMGFIEDVEEIMSHTPAEKRTLLFSATMPQRIMELSKTYMHDTEIVRVAAAQLTADLTDQIYFEVRESDKLDALTRIIDITPEFYGIIFTRTKVGTDELVSRLLERGYSAEALHGDISQAQREKVLAKFRNKQANILVATDVAARGIDISNLTHVINYSLPQDSESYVHRIGRTGRAGNQGTAITFISSSEMRRFGFMRRDIKADIRREELPSPQDIVATKRQHIKDELREIVAGNSYAACSDMAAELLQEYSPEVALGALLQLAFSSDLDETKYPEIRSFSVDRRGTARLFIAIGRDDGYDVRKLVALLKRECGLRDKHINDIKLGDSYSFVSVPFSDAEEVVNSLNKLRRGKRPLAEIADRKRSETEDDNVSKKRRSKGKRGKDTTDDTQPDNCKETERKSIRPSDMKEPTAERSSKKDKMQKHDTHNARTKDKTSEGHVSTYAPAFNNGGFDWSLFEKNGNRWNDRPTKGKKRK